MVKEYQLSNGMKVLCDRLDNVQSIAFGVWITVGSEDEDTTNNGMAHMIEHMVFKGTKKRTAKQIADEMAEIGGNLDAYTTKEWTVFYAWILKENIAKAIDLMGDMLRNSLFKEEDLTREKSIILEEIDMYKDSAEDVVQEMLERNIWENHPLGFLISGEAEVVESFRRESVEEFHRKHYTADHMLISIAGAVDIDEILKLLEDSFAEFPVKSQEIDEDSEPLLPVFHPCIYVEEKDIEQVHINLAYHSITSTANERYACSVLNSILGGGANSHLFMRIREEMGIAYTIYSYENAYQKAGLFHIYAVVGATQTKAALIAMGQEIKRFATEGPSEIELLRAKEQIKTDIMIQRESTKGHMNGNAEAMLQFGYLIPFEETIKRVNMVSREDVMDCMKKIFVREKLATALVGNLKEMEYEVNGLEDVTKYF